MNTFHVGFNFINFTLKVVGSPDIAYTSHETPMVMYLNTSVAIDQLRGKAELAGRIGAKVGGWEGEREGGGEDGW